MCVLLWPVWFCCVCVCVRACVCCCVVYVEPLGMSVATLWTWWNFVGWGQPNFTMSDVFPVSPSVSPLYRGISHFVICLRFLVVGPRQSVLRPTRTAKKKGQRRQSTSLFKIERRTSLEELGSSQFVKSSTGQVVSVIIEPYESGKKIIGIFFFGNGLMLTTTQRSGKSLLKSV